MKVIYKDANGVRMNQAEFEAVFGPVEVVIAGADDFTFQVAVLQDSGNHVACSSEIKVLIDGEPPPEGTYSVGWHWPGAPLIPGTDVRAEVIPLDGRGIAGPAMGGGAFYNPGEGVGPHSVWVTAYPDGLVQSEVVKGIGWFDDHRHVNVTFYGIGPHEEPPDPDPEPEPEPDPDPEPDPEPELPDDNWAALFERLDKMIELMEKEWGEL